MGSGPLRGTGVWKFPTGERFCSRQSGLELKRCCFDAQHERITRAYRWSSLLAAGCAFHPNRIAKKSVAVAVEPTVEVSRERGRYFVGCNPLQLAESLWWGGVPAAA